ncbi:MAG TPA: DUF47 family protein [Patescibacteria group bacterium]|jgi:predicted phosphate transport protein (TIGR00153 family)|nr:DUF47 family protein [Patescibacteria group bacterium]
MMFGFLSNDKAFFDIFADMADKINEAAGLLKAMVETAERPEEYAARIKHVEHQCDELTHNLVRKLNSTFITPLDREDIHDLAVKLDDVVDLIDSTADRMVAFRIKGTSVEVHGLTDVLRRQTEVIKLAVTNLGRTDKILDRCIEIHSLENEGDRLFHKGLVRLFSEVKDPIELLKQKEIIEKIEHATDRCEDVANVLEGIMLKNA